MTSPKRTYDGYHMGLELSAEYIPFAEFPAGLVVQFIVNGKAQPEKYYVDFTETSNRKLDWIPIQSGGTVQIKYDVFGCDSVTLKKVVSYSWY